MPIYEFLCQQCGHEFEQLVRYDEKPACPACGRRRLTKKLSLPVAHTAGASQPPCAAREAGMCNPAGCCGPGCDLTR